MRKLSKLKQAVMALFTVAVLAGGVPGEAQALFVQGDLVFVAYGNGTEYYQNLGTVSSLLAPSASTNFVLDLTAAGGANPVSWALLSWAGSSTPTNIMDWTSPKPLADWNSTELNQVLFSQFRSRMDGWRALSASLASPVTLPSSDAASFSNAFNNNLPSLGGTLPVNPAGSFDSLLYVLQRGTSTSSYSQLGYAVLNATGTLLTIAAGSPPAAVPLPAAVILFGTGLIGLAGVARRQKVL